MSIFKREVPFTLKIDGREEKFFGIEELGFGKHGSFIIDAWTTPFVPGEPRGNWMTSIPISPKEYRKQHGHMNAGFLRERDSLTLFDDWGHRTIIQASPDILNYLVGECVEQELPNKKEEK